MPLLTIRKFPLGQRLTYYIKTVGIQLSHFISQESYFLFSIIFLEAI